MPTVTKTWVFLANTENLADVGDSAITVGWDATGGNPAGSLEFLGGASGTTERARKAATGETWETWGAPAGSTITDVTVTTADSRIWNAGSPVKTGTLSVRIVGSGATTVHSAGDIFTRSLPGANDAAWVNSAGTSRAVDAGSQPSTTDVRLEVQLTISGLDVSYDLGVDNIAVQMTYTTGAPPAMGPAFVPIPFIR